MRQLSYIWSGKKVGGCFKTDSLACCCSEKHAEICYLQQAGITEELLKHCMNYGVSVVASGYRKHCCEALRKECHQWPFLGNHTNIASLIALVSSVKGKGRGNGCCLSVWKEENRKRGEAMEPFRDKKKNSGGVENEMPLHKSLQVSSSVFPLS